MVIKMAKTKIDKPEEKVVVKLQPTAIKNPCPRCGAELIAISGRGMSGTDYECKVCGLKITK